jgi:hypothetical protein
MPVAVLTSHTHATIAQGLCALIASGSAYIAHSCYYCAGPMCLNRQWQCLYLMSHSCYYCAGPMCLYRQWQCLYRTLMLLLRRANAPGRLSSTNVGLNVEKAEREIEVRKCILGTYIIIVCDVLYILFGYILFGYVHHYCL